MSGFAKRLRELREAKGWTRYRLARVAGLTTEGVVKLEGPGSDPKLSTLFKLAAALGVEPGELLAGVRPGKGKPRGKRPAGRLRRPAGSDTERTRYGGPSHA